jgi:micrococcal nuclease
MKVLIPLLCLFLLLPAHAEGRETLPGPVRGEVLSVLDGDTVTVRLHIWIGQQLETHVRLAGIDTPEMHGKCADDRKLAAAARQALEAALGDGKIFLYDIRDEKYAGRVMAKARNSDGIALSQHMIDKGLARPYAGRKRAGWCA